MFSFNPNAKRNSITSNDNKRPDSISSSDDLRQGDSKGEDEQLPEPTHAGERVNYVNVKLEDDIVIERVQNKMGKRISVGNPTIKGLDA